MAPRQQAAHPDETAVWRVRWQLAALTAGLFSILLLVLGLLLYVGMRKLQLDELQTVLRRDTNTVLAVIGSPWMAPRRGTQPAVPYRERAERTSSWDNTLAVIGQQSGISIVIADQHLRVVSGIPDAGGPRLYDPAAALQTVRTRAQHFSMLGISHDGEYLVYTTPILQEGILMGVAQARLPTWQYAGGLDSLARVLGVDSVLGCIATLIISAFLVRRALQPIRAALRRQRDFVADAAHELRTPLSIGRAAAELGLASEAEADHYAALEQTLVQNTHLTRLVEDLSLLARADSGAVPLERTRVDLSRLVRATVADMELLARAREIALAPCLQDGIQVLGDQMRLRQVVLIVIDNALRHTPPGGQVSIGLEHHSGRARLVVKDTGVGIAPGDLPHLFDRFYRADRARGGEGAGLGLAIGHWIVQAHRGSITAANAPGGGAQFTIDIPVG
jgi:signal transduction histidine kinase